MTTETNESMNEVDELLREHYTAQSLNRESLDRLKQQIQMAETAANETGTTEQSSVLEPRRLPILSMVSGLAACLAIGVSLAFWMHTSSQQDQEFTNMVVAEVVMNHRKDFKPDYTNQDFDQLNAKMHKLDFQMVKSDQMGQKDLTLVGVRYCSVGPLIAAQLKYTDERGRVYTLYQSKDDPQLKVVKNHSQVRDGTSVEVWRESGVFMALAGPAE